MPLHGGICEYEPEHTPFPADLTDPALPKWYTSWLRNYNARISWREKFEVLGPFQAFSRDQDQDGLSSWFDGFPMHSNASNSQCTPADQSDDEHEELHFERPEHATETCSRTATSSVMRPEDPQHAEETISPEGAVQTSGAAVNVTSLAKLQGLGLPNTISAWLLEVDSQGFLRSYAEIMVQHFDSPRQLLDVYLSTTLYHDGNLCFDERFFNDMGVAKLGHRRLFERWLTDILQAPKVQNI